MRFKKLESREIIKKYSIAILSVGVVWALRIYLDPWLDEDGPLLAFVIAVICSALYGDLGPGLMATFLSGLVGTLYFYEHPLSTVHTDITYLIDLTLFIVSGVVLSLLFYSRNKEQKRATKSLQNTEAAVEILQQTQRLLEQSNERFRLLMANVSDYAILILNPDGYIIDWNKGAERITGYTEQEAIGSSGSILFTYEDRIAGIPERELERARLEGRAPDIRWHVRKNGDRFWADGYTTALRDEAGHLKGFIKVARDMTEHKRTGDALRETQSLLDAIVNAAPVGIAIFDLEGRFIRMNQVLAGPYGIQSSELIGRTMHDYIPAIADRMDQVHREVISTGHVVTNIEFSGEIHSGERRYWTTSFYPVHSSDGSICGAGAIINDVTVAKRAEENLRQSEANFRALAETIPQLVWYVKPDFSLEYCNGRWLEYTGMTEEDASGFGWLHAIHPDDRENARLSWESARHERTVSSAESRIRRKDGCYRWHLCRAMPVYDENGQLIRWFGTDTDIHDQKRWQEELSRAKLAAEDASQAKSAFLANMSHEIRTPLGAILGFSELLRDESLNAEDKAQFIETINRNGRDLARLIDDILDLSKVEAGRLEVEKLSVSLVTLMNDIKQSLSIRAQEKGVRFELKWLGRIPTTIESDSTRLRQILLNIIGNAIKFTEKGYVVVTIRLLDPESPDANPKICFTVTDTGRGIDPSQVHALFQPFSQADRTTTRKYGGTGLGLVLSRRLAHLLGGDVTLTDSAPGVGSTFSITIDAGHLELRQFVEVGYSKGENQEFERMQQEERLKGIKVLVADDAADNRFLIQRLLTSSGAKVDLVENGAEAVESALKGSYDVVLMDIQMPVLDGFDATQTLRNKGYRKPIIALTAYALPEEREKSLRAGCNDHLAKPISRNHLIYTVAQYAHPI